MRPVPLLTALASITSLVLLADLGHAQTARQDGFPYEPRGEGVALSKDPETGSLDVEGIDDSGEDGVSVVGVDPADPTAPAGGSRTSIGPIRWTPPASMDGRQYETFDIAVGAAAGSGAAIVIHAIDIHRDAISGFYRVRRRGTLDTEWEEATAELLGMAEADPLFQDMNPPSETDLCEVAGLPGELVMLLYAADDEDENSSRAARRAPGPPTQEVVLEMRWDELQEITFLPGTPEEVTVVVDRIRVRSRAVSSVLDRLTALDMTWSVADGQPGAARVLSTSGGAFGRTFDTSGAVHVDTRVDPIVDRQRVRLSNLEAPGSVRFEDDLLNQRVRLDFGIDGTPPSGALVHVDLESTTPDATTRRTSLAAIGEGTDTIVDLTLDGRSVPARWEYEHDGSVLATSSLPPDRIPDAGVHDLAAAGLWTEADGSRHVHELVLTSPRSVVSGEGEVFEIDRLRAIADLGVATDPGVAATVALGASRLGEAALEWRGVGTTYTSSTNPLLEIVGLDEADVEELRPGRNLLRNVGERTTEDDEVARQSLPPDLRARVEVSLPDPGVKSVDSPIRTGIGARASAVGGGVAFGPGATVSSEVVGEEVAHVLQPRGSTSGAPRRRADEITYLRRSFGELVETVTLPSTEPYTFGFAGLVDAMGVELAEGADDVHRIWFTWRALGATAPRQAMRRVTAAPAHVEMRIPPSASDPLASLDAVSLFASGVPWLLFDDAVTGASVPAPGPVPAGRLRMDRAFPNPLNPRTSIVLRSARPTDASLLAYDARGRRVDRLFDGRIEAGATVLTWDGLDAKGQPLASGTYFLRLVDGEGRTIDAQKVVLVR